MNTRQYPRTLEQAFGPYARGPVHPLPEPRGYGAAWWWAMACIAVVTVIVIAGCAAPMYRQTRADAPPFDQAHLECQYEVAKAAGPSGGNWYGNRQIGLLCMATKGWVAQ